MKERIINYLNRINDLLKNPPEDADWDDILKEHLTQIQFFQHERFIHLVVTVTFAIMTMMVLIGFVACGKICLAILLIPLVILLFPYIMHYYLLENSVQAMYDQYDKMLVHIREQKN